MSQSVLVTGGAGYLGSVLVPRLLDAGFAVTVLDSFMYRQSSLMDCCHRDNFRIAKGDARDRDTLEPLLREADYIIPLAALVGAPLCDNDKTGAVTINRDAVKTILELRSPNQRIVSPCTNSGYGIGESGIHCTEDSPLRPVSLYGRVKVEAEKAILDAGNGISLRLATVFGTSPRMRTDLLVNDFVHRAVRDRCLVVFEGHFKRNYIHVRDVAGAFLHAIKNFETMKNEPYNVGLSDANLSKLELCAKIQEQIPKFVYLESEIGKDPDKRDYIVSNEKIEATGFRPEHSLEMGIRELRKAYQILTTSTCSNV